MAATDAKTTGLTSKPEEIEVVLMGYQDEVEKALARGFRRVRLLVREGSSPSYPLHVVTNARLAYSANDVIYQAIGEAHARFCAGKDMSIAAPDVLMAYPYELDE